MIEGKLKSDEVIALRADMDALPIQETNQVEYASKHPGIMHARARLSHFFPPRTIKISQALRDNFGGTIKLLFQPGEEVLPGGASLMIKEGVLDHPSLLL